MHVGVRAEFALRASADSEAVAVRRAGWPTIASPSRSSPQSEAVERDVHRQARQARRSRLLRRRRRLLCGKAVQGERADLERGDVEVAGEKLPWPPAKLGVVETDQGALLIGERDVLEAQVLRKSPLETPDGQRALLAAGQPFDQPSQLREAGIRPQVRQGADDQQDGDNQHQAESFGRPAEHPRDAPASGRLFSARRMLVGRHQNACPMEI